MTDCETFREHAEELALDATMVAKRDELLAHAASCTACQAHLDALTQVADRMLLMVTEIEPPEGFEGRVLARLHPPDAVNAVEAAPTRHVGRRSWRALSIAAALVLLVGAGVAIGHWRNPSYAPQSASEVTRSGVIVRKDGSAAGHAQLVRNPVAHVLVTIDHPQPNPGRVSCRLTLADGTSVMVGTWGYDDVRAGVWSVGIDRALLVADRMDVLDASGAVLASAVLR